MNFIPPFVSAILVAGGIGSRMGSPIAKQFIKVQDKEIALYSFETLLQHEHIEEIIVVCKEEYEHLFHHPKVKFALPGVRRQDSAYNGFLKVHPKANLVCIHDSARPFLTLEDLNAVISEALIHKAAVLGTPVKPTLKEVDENGFVLRTLNRDLIWEVQTPQVIDYALLKKGFELANEKSLTVTDDVSLVELQNLPVKIIKGSYANIKITTPEDLDVANLCLNTK